MAGSPPGSRRVSLLCNLMYNFLVATRVTIKRAIKQSMDLYLLMKCSIPVPHSSAEVVSLIVV